jgi:hypothetical protein
MRRRTWLLFLTLVAASCERDFSRPSWKRDGVAASDDPSATAGAAGSGSAGAPYEPGDAGAGGDALAGKAGADSGGRAPLPSGDGGIGTQPGGAGSGGAPNRPPSALFDFQYFRRGLDGIPNPNAAKASATAGGFAGDATAGAAPPSFSYVFSSSLLDNDRDPDGDTLSVVAQKGTTERGGTVTVEESGSASYIPPSDVFWGDDFFNYVVSDGESSSSARVRVSISVPRVKLDELESGGNGWLMIGSKSHAGFGSFVGDAGDVNGDGFDDWIVAAPGAGNDGEGTVYVVFGREEKGPLLLEDLSDAGNGAGFVIKNFRLAFEQGRPVNGAGDLNGDGFDDLVIASLPLPGAQKPAVYVVFGRDSLGPVALDEVSVADGKQRAFRIDPTPAIEQFGTSVAKAGDVNGDGLDDLVIGAPVAARDMDSAVGAAYVILGTPALGKSPVKIQEISLNIGENPGFLLRGKRANARAGFDVAGAGDIDGDGLDDLVIGAPEEDPGEDFSRARGRAYVVFGRSGRESLDPGDVDLDNVDLGLIDDAFALSQADERGFLVQGDESAVLGYSVAGAGFFDGDAWEDVLFGIPHYPVLGGMGGEYVGGVYIATGEANALSDTLSRAPENGYLLQGGKGAYRLGRSVAAGDFDGDGRSDAALAGGDQAWHGYLAFGGSGDSNEYGDCEKDFGGGNALCFEHSAGVPPGPVAFGDCNADGVDDVLWGAASRAPAGVAHVVLGSDLRNRVEARHVVFSGGGLDDTMPFSGGEILRLSGGHGVDTVALEGAGFTWDLRAVEPARLVSIERIDLRSQGGQVLILDDGHVRSLPSSRPGLPAPLSKTLTVLGDAEDALRLDLGGFEPLPDFEGRRIYRRRGAYYGLEVDAALAIGDPPEAP